MCRKVACTNCKKSSWAGCGQHIEAALSGVVETDRCPNWKKGGACVTEAPAPAAKAAEPQGAAAGGK